MVRGRRALSKVVARSSIALSSLALSAFASNEARADASPVDKAAAQTLFDEGRRLMAAGKLADACPKLAESQKLDPGVGTQFHLSDCYERFGQTASAWAGFLEVAAAAKSAGQNDREKVARDRETFFIVNFKGLGHERRRAPFHLPLQRRRIPGGAVHAPARLHLAAYAARAGGRPGVLTMTVPRR